MLVGVFIVVTVSFITNEMFVKERLDRRYDILKCHRQKTIEQRDPQIKSAMELEVGFSTENGVNDHTKDEKIPMI